MKKLDTYEIPDEIRNIELHNDVKMLNQYKVKTQAARENENAIH